LDGCGLPSLQHPQRDHGYRSGVSLDKYEAEQQDCAPDQQRDNNQAVPREFVAPETQAEQLYDESNDKEGRTRQVHMPKGWTKPVLRVQLRHGMLRILQHAISNNKGEDGYWNLEKKAPSPPDGIGDCATEGRSQDSTESNKDILHCLIHTPLPEGDHVGVDDGC
jgi:hypothetical protein